VITVKAGLLLDMLAGKTSYGTAQLTGKVRAEGEPMAALALSTMVAFFRNAAEEPGAKGWPARKLAKWMASGLSR
jgi:putative sterol carrier protein